MKYLVNEHEKTMKDEYVENLNKISETYEEYAFNKENTKAFLKKYNEMITNKQFPI